MHGFGSHAFSFINIKNERFWVKFHFQSQQGIKNLMDDEAADLIGKDRESAQRDLFNAIDTGRYPRWTLFVQIMPEHNASHTPYNPFDVTKVWPHSDYPLIEVGYFELNRNPNNYFSEVEQVALNPANIVPGISFSPDRMLQGRLFAYGDTQRYRLGVNHFQIPVNAAKCPFQIYHRDGAMRVDGNSSDGVTYEPNSFGAFQEQSEFREPPLSITSPADHWDHREDNDYFSQPRALFSRLSREEHMRMFTRIADELSQVPEFIQKRQVCLFAQVHPEYGAGVAAALGLDI